jgi:hypothetical protein
MMDMHLQKIIERIWKMREKSKQLYDIRNNIDEVITIYGFSI